MNQRSRFIGAMLGLAYGDVVSFPAMFHRFGAMNPRRHAFLWRTNAAMDAMGISSLTLPFTHRDPAATMQPSPTDDTEYAILTLRALLEAPSEGVGGEVFLSAWQKYILPDADKVRGSVSVRAALDNFKRGLTPPQTGNDNPLHYEDSAAARAVPIGLYCIDDPIRAAELAGYDASITQAEDGIYAAQGMAAAISRLAASDSLEDGFRWARRSFPEGSWIAHNDAIAQKCRDEAVSPEHLALLLSQRLINTVYSYGNAAPETFPAALAIVEKCEGDLFRAVSVANLIPKCADSLPAMVGALCGAYQGAGVIPNEISEVLRRCNGICIPALANTDIIETTEQLSKKVLGT